jgi:hypothetical protein
MPPLRTPLAKRSGNITSRKELSKFKRGRIIRIHDGGANKATIQRFYSYLYSMVLDTITNNKLRDNGHSIPRSGAPKAYSLAEERRVLRHVCWFPKDIYA